jgi:small subunit ribosomal protein S8
MGSSYIDFIIRLKNGYLAGKEEIVSPYSRLNEMIAKKLVSLGYIKSAEVQGEVRKNLIIKLLYKDKKPIFTDVKIFSKPGRRYYVSYRDLKPVLSGLGNSIISTSKGLLTDKEAKKLKVGGELLFNIW